MKKTQPNDAIIVDGSGSALVTGSVVGHIAPPANLYSATKWAITGMAEGIRKALVGTGVRMTLVSPGKVDTPFWEETPDEPLLAPEDVAQARDDYFTKKTDDQSAALKVYVNPLVNWIWIGGYIFVIGSIAVMWPQSRRNQVMGTR